MTIVIASSCAVGGGGGVGDGDGSGTPAETMRKTAAKSVLLRFDH